MCAERNAIFQAVDSAIGLKVSVGRADRSAPFVETARDRADLTSHHISFGVGVHW